MNGPYTILGAGSWGTALALHLAKSGAEVRLWGHDPARTAELERTRENRVYLPGFPLPAGVRVLREMEPALAGSELVLLAAPSHSVRDVLIAGRPHFPERASLLIATKGIEVGTLSLMTEVASSSLGVDSARVAVLSGPSFAVEVARGEPTAVVVASTSSDLASRLQEGISSETLRLYTNEDPIGVQVAGALKNVMAIAAGVLAGLGLGSNSVAALLTRGLAEMRRLGTALGGRPETFAGLAGVGDLILTGTGDLSRNRRFGIELGRGRSPAEILAGMTMVAEGVRTAESAARLAARLGVEMPIVEQVRRVLYDGVPPMQAIAGLMSRRLRPEERL